MITENLLVKALKEKNPNYYYIILNVYEDVKPLLNQRIAKVFPNYTQHDTEHSFRIMNNMFKLIPDIDNLNELEISVLILAALLHDIGMAATEEEIHKIKNDELIYNEIKYTSLLIKFNGDEIEALQEYIRKVHAKRSSIYILKELTDHLLIPGMRNKSFANIVAEVCDSHTRDILWVKNNMSSKYIIGELSINIQFCSLLLRLGDILDFDGSRTPRRLYTAINPKAYSKEEWKQHFAIDNIDKITINPNTGERSIYIYGKCGEPNIYRKLLRYIEWINEEILHAIEMTKEFKNPHKLDIYYKVQNKITLKSYTFVDLKFQMNYQKTLKLLMGENLYGDKRVGLREIVQNSIDACLMLQEIKSKDQNIRYNQPYQPKIFIIIDKKNGQVKIKDNGKGMNIFELKNFFLAVGSSYFQSEEYLLGDYSYKPIGRYGIGFLTGFMLSNNILIRTKGYREDKLLEVEIQKDNEYVSIKEFKNLDFLGTEIIFEYSDFFKVFKNYEEIYKYISETFLIDEFEIHIDMNGELSNINSKKSDNKEFINLSKYLNNVEATIYFPKAITSESLFIQNIKDIKSQRIDFSYDGKKIYSNPKENISLRNYVNNNILKYISFMYVDDSNDLDEVINIEEHIGDIEDHYRENYTNDDIDIAISSNVKIPDYRNDFLISGDELVSGLKIDDLDGLDNYHHDNNSGTYVSTYELNFFGLEEVDKYIQLSKGGKSINANIYLRKVFIENRDMNVKNAINMKLFSKANIIINIIDENIIPDVSRKQLLNIDKNLISNSIYQALYLYLLENNNNILEETILKKYLKKYHNYSKTLLTEEYKNKINEF
ncbi:ATP-binding protein [Paenibacillus nicotianae]|uniref:ATP-binding protein n=1 Tax=Paenibacillus nicotianae TaxID=1526551 RepID=A0ABW4UZZ0_9BACL